MTSLSDIAESIQGEIEDEFLRSGQQRFFPSNFRELGDEEEIAHGLLELAKDGWLECRALLKCPEGHEFRTIPCEKFDDSISNTWCPECDQVYDQEEEIWTTVSFLMTKQWRQGLNRGSEKKKRR